MVISGLESKVIVKQLICFNFCLNLQKNLQRKLEVIQKYKLSSKLSVVETDGVSWNVRMVIKILLSNCDENFCDIYSDCDDQDELVTKMILLLLESIKDKLVSERDEMRKQLIDSSEPYKLCFSLLESHINLIEKAQSNVY